MWHAHLVRGGFAVRAWSACLHTDPQHNLTSRCARASAASAGMRKVLPVPGGPWHSTPRKPCKQHEAGSHARLLMQDTASSEHVYSANTWMTQ
jgi:hypothetical protein